MKLFFGVAAIVVLLPMVSCDTANNPSALAGHWLYESGSVGEKPENMELLKDGTGVCDGVSISWKLENKSLVLLSSFARSAFDYEISGYRLTLTHNGGKITYLDINNKTYQKSLQKGTFTDSRDGKKYGTTKIGTQTWMAENLNYDADGSKCYDNDPANCTKYGRLYAWKTALNVCPKGWHLPSDAEWGTLVDFAGEKIAGKKLKAGSGWNKNGNGVDIYGFSALPSGFGDSSGNFGSVGIYGYWWSSTEYATWIRYIFYYSASVDRFNSAKTYLYSVRCVQD